MNKRQTNIAWAKEIPLHWEYSPNKYLMKKIKKICVSYDGQDIISLSINGVVVRDLDAGGKMPTSFDGYQFVYPDNLLMCLFDYDVTPRCIGYISKYGITSPAYSQFVMKNGNSSKYYYYYYLMIDHTKAILHLAKNLRHSFTEEELGRINVIVPPAGEQKTIATFLDAKCKEVDEISEIIEKQIEILRKYKQSLIVNATTKGLNANTKMKESGIEWIGNIPAHWKTTKNRYIFNKNKTLVGAAWESTQLLSLTKKGIVIKGIDEGGGKQPGTFATYQYVEKGDLILCLFDLDVSAVFSGLSSLDGMISPAYKRYVCKEGYLNRYYKHYFDAVFSGRYYKYYSKNLRYTVDDDLFDSLLTVVPPLAEQKAIADFLDKKCAEIDEIIETKRQQLSAIDAYKKSLIYEYVTGKKEVAYE